MLHTSRTLGVDADRAGGTRPDGCRLRPETGGRRGPRRARASGRRDFGRGAPIHDAGPGNVQRSRRRRPGQGCNDRQELHRARAAAGNTRVVPQPARCCVAATSRRSPCREEPVTGNLNPTVYNGTVTTTAAATAVIRPQRWRCAHSKASGTAPPQAGAGRDQPGPQADQRHRHIGVPPWSRRRDPSTPRPTARPRNARAPRAIRPPAPPRPSAPREYPCAGIGRSRDRTGRWLPATPSTTQPAPQRPAQTPGNRDQEDAGEGDRQASGEVGVAAIANVPAVRY